MTDQLTPYQAAQLTGLGECFIHFHPREPLDQLSQSQLEAATIPKAVTGDYSLTLSDEQILVSTTSTVTLPPATKGKEYHLTMTSSGTTMTVVPTSPDTVLGTDSIVVTEQWTSLHLKATSASNWILV